MSDRKNIIIIGLVLFFSIFLPHISLANEMFWFGGPVGRFPSQVSGNMVFAPDEKVQNQPTQLSLVSGDLKYSIPLYMTASNDVVFFGKTQVTSLDTEAVLPVTGTPLPNSYYDISFGPGYRHQFNNGWVLGTMLEAGSASNEPFASYDDLTIMGNAFLRIPVRGKDSWIVFLNYMNNREYLPHVPLPFGGYFMNRKYVSAFFGVPMVLNIFPAKNISLQLFYAPIAVVRAQIKGKVSKSVSLLSGFNWNNYTYFRNGRANKDDRLFYYQKRVYGGIEVSPDMRAKVRLKMGYAFNRNMFESDSFLDRGRNRINVDSGPYVRLEVNLLLISREQLKNKYSRRR